MALPLIRLIHGSAMGGSHVDSAKNGQDAYSIRQTPEYLVVATADGCGSLPHSEVGAKIVVHMATSFVMEILRKGLDLENPLVQRHLKNRLLAQIQTLADAMAGDKLVTEIFSDFFNFTLLLMVMTEKKTIFLAIGDGVWGLNGVTTVIDPTVGNKPPYIVYNLSGSDITNRNPELLDFQVLEIVPTKNVKSFWIGTDGVKEMLNAVGKRVLGAPIVGVSGLLADPYYYDYVPGKANTPLARRLMELTADHIGDDVTLVAGELLWPLPPAPETDEPAEEEATDTEEPDNTSDEPGKSEADDSSATSEDDSDNDSDADTAEETEEEA